MGGFCLLVDQWWSCIGKGLRSTGLPRLVSGVNNNSASVPHLLTPQQVAIPAVGPLHLGRVQALQVLVQQLLAILSLQKQGL